MSARDLCWSVPYVQEVQNIIHPGQTLNVKGFVIGNERFDINLTTGLRNGDKLELAEIDQVDFALHISCRLSEGMFVLNSLIDDGWGEEQRHSLPFKEGQEFSVSVRATVDHFQLCANGKEVGKYRYRLPLDSTKYIYVKGDCELYHVDWEGGGALSVQREPHHSPPTAADSPGVVRRRHAAKDK